MKDARAKEREFFQGKSEYQDLQVGDVHCVFRRMCVCSMHQRAFQIRVPGPAGGRMCCLRGVC